jgi:hypothetical protein
VEVENGRDEVLARVRRGDVPDDFRFMT